MIAVSTVVVALIFGIIGAVATDVFIILTVAQIVIVIGFVVGSVVDITLMIVSVEIVASIVVSVGVVALILVEGMSCCNGGNGELIGSMALQKFSGGYSLLFWV